MKDREEKERERRKEETKKQQKQQQKSGIILLCSKYLHRLNTDFSVLFLGFELQLNVEQSNLGAAVPLGLHLKPSVGEGLLEGHPSNQERLLQAIGQERRFTVSESINFKVLHN